MEKMEMMVLSYAHYTVKDFEKVISAFKELEKGGLFVMDSTGKKSHGLTGGFVRDYPKNHWNPLSKLLGARQVVGGAELKNGILTIDAKTRGGLAQLRKIVEERLSRSVEFKHEEFRTFGGMPAKR